MEQLLTKKDLAERWQVSEQTIDEYREKGIIKQVPKIPSVRFNPQHIAEIEETKLDRFSPIERRKLEREIEEKKIKLEQKDKEISDLKATISRIVAMGSEIIYSKES
jgi:hypothetical protein